MFSSATIAAVHHVIGNSVCHFMNLWNCGLRPTLKVETQLNGCISINSNVTFYPALQQENDVVNQQHRKRSGKASRRRRKLRRNFKTKNGNGNAVVCTNGNETLDQTVAEHSPVNDETFNSEITTISNTSTTSSVATSQVQDTLNQGAIIFLTSWQREARNENFLSKNDNFDQTN